MSAQTTPSQIADAALPLTEGPLALSPGQQLRERLAARHQQEREGGPIRLAYVTSISEIESEGVGGLISRENDTLSFLQSYRLNGHLPTANDSSSQHLYHILGQTYQVTLIIADDDVISPRMGSRMGTTGLGTYVHPSSGWRAIRNKGDKEFAKARYEWTAFNSKHIVHDYDIVLSDSYRMLFAQTALNGRLFSSAIDAAEFTSTLQRFNDGVSPRIELSFGPEDAAALALPGSSISRNGFTIQHEVDPKTGASLNRIALFTLPMQGLILNVHPAYTADLPGYTPTSDAMFRNALLRRANSSENFVVRLENGEYQPIRGQTAPVGERFYRIPLRDAYLFSVQSPRELLFDLAEQRITGISADDHARLSSALDVRSWKTLHPGERHPLDGATFQAVKEKTTRNYRLQVRGERILVFENEATRARALFVDRRDGPFRATSVEQDGSGNWWLITPMAKTKDEEGRFLSKTGATAHYVDKGIDTGAAIQFSRSTPIRRSDTSHVSSMDARPHRPTMNANGEYVLPEGARELPRSRKDQARRLAKMQAVPRGEHIYRDGEQRLRERNYATKGNMVVRALSNVLNNRDMQARIAADRQARQDIRNNNPGLARAHYRANRR